jgi:RHS repeat-associated protein
VKTYGYSFATSIPERAYYSSFESGGWNFMWYEPQTDELLGIEWTGNYNAAPHYCSWFAFSDALGNTRSLVVAGEHHGEWIRNQSYSPFGEMEVLPANHDNDTWAWAPSFQGKTYDFETGFYDYRAREYDPSVGRYVTRAAEPTYEESAYMFPSNDPVNNKDPTGDPCRRTKYEWGGWCPTTEMLKAYLKYCYENAYVKTYHWFCILEWAEYGAAEYLAGRNALIDCPVCLADVTLLIASILVPPAWWIIAIEAAVAAVSCSSCISEILDYGGLLNPPDCEPVTYEPNPYW